MSQWTHINAVIRFDCLAMLGMKFPDLSNVPSGSEGDMQVQIWHNPSSHAMASHTVMFWGDLRDYSNDKEVLDYFTDITKGQMISSGLLEIDVESRPTVVYRHDRKGWQKITETTDGI